MPIHVPITFPRLTEAEMLEVDYVVMDHAFASHRELGRLCDELNYQADLAARLIEAGFESVIREMPVTVTFRGFRKVYEIDLVVLSRVIYELKTVSVITKAHIAQLLNYLMLVGSNRGKIINFRPNSVSKEFVNAPVRPESRFLCRIRRDRWTAPDNFTDLIVDLLADIGAGLELPLYLQALSWHLGGEEKVDRLLPLQRGTTKLAAQRFHLLNDDEAFALTAFPASSLSQQQKHLQNLLALSPLKSIHWINTTLQDLHLQTLTA
jgi:GxxExxY protein